LTSFFWSGVAVFFGVPFGSTWDRAVRALKRHIFVGTAHVLTKKMELPGFNLFASTPYFGPLKNYCEMVVVAKFFWDLLKVLVNGPPQKDLPSDK